MAGAALWPVDLCRRLGSIVQSAIRPPLATCRDRRATGAGRPRPTGPLCPPVLVPRCRHDRGGEGRRWRRRAGRLGSANASPGCGVQGMTGSPSDTLLGQALALAAAGLAVFPLGPTRVPLRDSHGHLDASKDSADVRRLFAAPAAANIGVATGEISGIDILDTDPRNGAGDWSDAGRLPVTRTYETRRGGRHFVFRHAPGLRCSTGRIAPGVDVKSNGGWATYHPAAGCPVLVEGPIADWPDWLLPKAMAPVRNSPAANRLEGGAVSARSAIEILDALPNPQSNGRDVYVAVMLAAAGAADASDDPAAVGAAAVGWAARWPESPGYSLE